MKVVVLLLNLLVGVHSFIVPKLLLPYFDKVQVNYTIVAEEGCYKWRSLNPGVASIHQIPDESEGCSRSAVVVVESKVPYKKTTLLLAEIEQTGTVLQCDVIVDQINKIDIVSRTRELYLEDPPEKLKIRALDDEGNTFSSTAGMLFEWNLQHDTTDEGDMQVLAHTILRVEKFIDTMYNADSYVEELEKEGLQSDTILISGLQTGAAYVTASMDSTTTVQTAKVKITVRDKVLLHPSGDIWLQQHGVVRYNVEKWRKGKSTEIKLPHPQYYLQLNPQDPTDPVTTFHVETSTVTGQRVGKSTIMLMDKNLKQQTAQASSDIYVSTPAYLKIGINPQNRWVLETGRVYVLFVEIFDGDNHKFYVGDNTQVETLVDEHHFKVLESSKNGTWFLVKAEKPGNCEIHAKLPGIFKPDGEFHNYTPVVKTKQVAEIFDPITVSPKLVVFPWQPVPNYYHHHLKANGGSGNYTWSIDNNLAVINSAGVVMTNVENRNKPILGSATAKATDVRNSAHWGASKILILPVVEIFFTPSPREAKIGSDLDLYISMLAIVDGEKVKIVDCRESNIKWQISDVSIFDDVSVVDLPLDELEYTTSACGAHRFHALQQGYTTVTATYSQTYEDGEVVDLSVSATIAAYPRLEAIDPPELAVLSLDSSKTLRFVGGPIRWPHWHAGYHRKIHHDNEQILEVSSISSSQVEHRVTCRCMKLGVTGVTLHVFNKPCSSNPFPMKATIQIKVSCTTPTRIEVVVPPLLQTCPLHNTHSVQAISLINDMLMINVTAYDEHDNMFDNFTSLALDWSSETKQTVFSEDKNHFDVISSLATQTKHTVIQSARMPSEASEQIVSVTISQYKLNIDPRICAGGLCLKVEPEVSGGVAVMVVSTPTLLPNQIVLHDHVNSSHVVRIEGGSRYFYHSLKQDHVVVHVKEYKQQKLEVTSVTGGTAQLRVYDHCLPLSIVSTAEVIVTQVETIRLKVTTRMEVGSMVEAKMEIFDKNGNFLPARFVTFLDLELGSSPAVLVSTGDVHIFPSDDLILISDVIALKVGSVMLQCTSRTRSGKLIRSNSVHITIFPVVELLPPLVTLIKHASFQLTIKGGPHSDYSVRYLLESSDPSSHPSINITQDGFVHALKVGQVQVHAEVVMSDGEIFKCKAPSIVRVVQLSGVRIFCPLNRFHVGSVVPVHVEATSSGDTSGQIHSPMTFGNALPGLLFRWNVANPSVARIRTVHKQAGIETSESMQFSVLLEGVTSGHTSVIIHVTATHPSLDQLAGEKLSAEISITVFDPLAIRDSPSKQWVSTNNLLITPKTTHKINPNRDGVAQEINYQVLRNEPCNDATKGVASSDDCVTISKSGVIQSGSSACDTSLLVTSVEKMGVNQTLVLHINVRHVAYVIARSQTQFRQCESLLSSDVADYFPVSSSLKFVVDEFDNTGDKFDATSSNIVISQNRYDLVEVEPSPGNLSFIVHTTQGGSTVLSVASYLSDETSPNYYFPITVDQPIKPNPAIVSAGIRFRFTTNFLNNDVTMGKWSSSKPNRLIVNPTTGGAVATTISKADVIYATDTFTSSNQVTVKPFEAGLSKEGIPQHLLMKRHEFLIEIKGEDPEVEPPLSRDLMNDVARQLFKCGVNLRSGGHQPFTPTSEFIPEKGRFACVIEPVTSSDEGERLASLDDEIQVTVTSRSRDVGHITEGHLTLDLAPNFVVVVTSQVIREGIGGKFCLKANSIVLPSVQVSCKDDDVIKIAEDTSHPGCYAVTLKGSVGQGTTEIHVTSEITGQDEAIQFKVEGRSLSPSGLNKIGECKNQLQQPWFVSYEESYRMIIYTIFTVVISTFVILGVFGIIRRLTFQTVEQPSTSFLVRTSPSRNPDYGYSPGYGTPSPKPRLWSRHYEPQQASTSTG